MHKKFVIKLLNHATHYGLRVEKTKNVTVDCQKWARGKIGSNEVSLPVHTWVKIG